MGSKRARTGANFRPARAIPWILSLVSVVFLVMVLLSNNATNLSKEESVTVRNIEFTLPPPPSPPPPIRDSQPEAEPAAPTIDLLGPGEGPSLDYSKNPKLSVLNIERIQKPDLELGKVDFSKSLSVNFPVLEVKELDQVPRLVSNNRISFPRELRSRKIKRVATKVEIIIDQNGKAYVKKIIDPVYPEMIEVIRQAINDSRFTVPRKNGQPVQAVYLYNLVFINRA